MGENYSALSISRRAVEPDHRNDGLGLASVGRALLLLGLLGWGPVVAAEGFSLVEAFQAIQALPEVGGIGDNVGSSLDSTSATQPFTDGTSHSLTSGDDSATLGDGFSGSSTAYQVDGNTVVLSTSSASLADGVDNPGVAIDYTIQTVVDGRPWKLEWSEPLNTLGTSNRFTATINDRRVTLILPEGKTLFDLSGSLPITLLDENGRVIVDNTPLNAISRNDVLRLARDLGVIDLDLALRRAQNQAMALGFNLVSDRLNLAQIGKPFAAALCKPSATAWAGSQWYEVGGSIRGSEYAGTNRTHLIGMEACGGAAMLGLALGHGESSVESSAVKAHNNLGGNSATLYGAAALLNGKLVIDAIGLYQQLSGSAYNQTLVVPMRLSGSRRGGRLAASYFIAPGEHYRIGLNVGGAVLDDDLTGRYLGTSNAYGFAKGELFSGVKFHYTRANQGVFASLIYHQDVTKEVDDEANVLTTGKGGHLELRAATDWQMARQLSLTASASAMLLDADAHYYGGSLQMAYEF